MYRQQHLADLGELQQNNEDFQFQQQQEQQQQQGQHLSIGDSRNVVDPNLYHDLVEFFPLVQTYLERDKKKNSSFTRRGSMVYTKTPSKESLSKKMTDMKGRSTQSIPAKKRRDHGDADEGGDGFLVPSARDMEAEKDRGELKALREQVEDLQKKLLQRDEQLKSAEISKDKMNEIYEKLDDMNHHAKQKDALIHSTQSQLNDVKIKLADRQAALEKTQWEAMTFNQKAEKLQEDLENKQEEISCFVQLFEGLTDNNPPISGEDYDIEPYQMSHFPQIDDLDEIKIERIEEARKAYINAIAIAKHKQDEDSIIAAASSRLYLQSFVLRNEAWA